MLIPLTNTILFAFLEEVSDGQFRERTSWGLELAMSPDQQAKNARWGRVLAIGPDIKSEVQPEDRIYIEPLMWTPGFEMDGVKIWRTDITKVLVVDRSAK